MRRFGSDRRLVYLLGWIALLVTTGTISAAQAPAVSATAAIADAAASQSAALPAAPQNKPKTKKARKPQAHPSLQLGKGTHIDVRARVQGDVATVDAADPADRSTVDIARRAVGASGEIAHVIGFQVERELGGDAPWRDVYVDYKQFAALRVQGGHFKLPFSLEQNTAATNLDFVNRSLAATHLAPGRDRGVMVHGHLLRRRVAYEAGVFDHDGRNARTRNALRVYGGRTMAARVVVEPFRTKKQSHLADLAFGIATTTSRLDEGVPALRGRTVTDARFLGSTFIVNGPRRRTGVEAQWTAGSFSVKSEYMRVLDARNGLSVENTDLSPLFTSGWYVAGTWLVTGERKSNAADAPARPVFRGGIGAVELAVRTEALAFGSTARGQTPSTALRADAVLGNRDRAETLGVNWYLNRWMKLQVNVVHETLADPAQGPRPSQAGWWNRVIRFQFSL